MGNFYVRAKYEELTFHDDFMFCKVLENNPELCRELLELILGRPVGPLAVAEKQKPIEITPDHRGVRFDIYAKDDKSVVYDIEMQNMQKDSLERRVRYSKSMMDHDNLEKGVPYSRLKNSYVIYICRFNMFPEVGRHKYSFRHICVEEQGLELGDGTEIIFLCTEGEKDDVTPEVRSFLGYVSRNTPEGSFTRRLEDAVDIARRNPIWRMEFMNLQEMIEARHEELIKENERLTEENAALTQKANMLAQETDALTQERDTALLHKAEMEARITELEKLLQKNGISIQAGV